jgi:hypothetical protein
VLVRRSGDQPSGTELHQRLGVRSRGSGSGDPPLRVSNVQAFADAELALLAQSHGGDYKRTCAWLDEQPLLHPELSAFSSAMPIIFRTLVPLDEEQLKRSLGGF